MVEYEEFDKAEAALTAMDGAQILGSTISVSWAYSKGPIRR